jgi:hypothetical protein
LPYVRQMNATVQGGCVFCVVEVSVPPQITRDEFMMLYGYRVCAVHQATNFMPFCPRHDTMIKEIMQRLKERGAELVASNDTGPRTTPS